MASDRSHPNSKTEAERSGINLKQCYSNGLADPLGLEQLKL